MGRWGGRREEGNGPTWGRVSSAMNLLVTNAQSVVNQLISFPTISLDMNKFCTFENLINL